MMVTCQQRQCLNVAQTHPHSSPSVARPCDLHVFSLSFMKQQSLYNSSILLNTAQTLLVLSSVWVVFILSDFNAAPHAVVSIKNTKQAISSALKCQSRPYKSVCFYRLLSLTGRILKKAVTHWRGARLYKCAVVCCPKSHVTILSFLSLSCM